MSKLKVGRKPPAGLATMCVTLLFTFVLLLVSQPAGAYVKYDKAGGGNTPGLSRLDLVNHDVNAVILMVSNQGPIGLNMETGNGTGFFPSNTSNNYVFGTGLWFGARFDADGDGDLDKVFVQGYNPLAGDSEFREGSNDLTADDPLSRIFDSTEQGDLDDWPDQFRVLDDGELVPFVRSDQDLVTTYTTLNKIPVFGSFQLPLEVNQRSMAFKTGLAAQAIFFILDVENYGDDVLENAWVGYDNDMDVGVSFSDDLTSFIVNRITPEGDTVRVNMAYAWDSDFVEANYTGDPGFVGIAYLRSPGNPFDGIDNDGDGLVDESPFNGIDDDGERGIDDPFEVDELGLVNYTKHCNPSSPCEVNDPQTDEDGYDMISCISENNPDSTSPTICLESTTPADIRFMMSSGPFDWLPGQSQQVVLAMVFANPRGDRDLPFDSETGRPDPNDDDLVELLEVKDVIQGVFDLDFLQAAPPPAPNMSLIPGDGQVTILWDDLPLRTADRTYEEFVELDSTYREFDFQGYRVWRSRTGTFSRRGDVNSPDFPLTPEAIEENELVDGFDLTLLAQYDLADGITTDSLGETCADSMVLQSGDVVFTNCDTFNLGTDTGLRFSYVDRGEATLPLVNGFRYFYSVTAYDFNSDALPVSRLSLDSGVSFPAENSTIPRSNASSYMDAFSSIYHVDPSGNVLDDTSSIFVEAGSGQIDPVSEVHASNALVDFTFNTGIPEEVSDDYYDLVLDSFERIDNISNRISFHLEDASGATVSPGTATSFDLVYDGTDQTVSPAVFRPDPENPENAFEVIFTADLTFNVDTAAIVVPSATEDFFAVNASGASLTDSIGNVVIAVANMIPAGFRGTDIVMEWTAVDEAADTLTLVVRDLDNMVDVPFGEGIWSGVGAANDAMKGSNWSFLPAGGSINGRYYVGAGPSIVELWVSGIRIFTGPSLVGRFPQAGDVWTLRQSMYTMTVDTTVTPPDTSWSDAQRPPVPGTTYRLDTQSGGQEEGSVDLTQIRVVPNPYLATSSFELGPNQKRIEFVNLPPECTIRIYTISGNLVNVLDHTPDEGGTEVFNLRTRFNLEMASGNYYYHVTTPDGMTHLGRFAVVQ